MPIGAWWAILPTVLRIRLILQLRPQAKQCIINKARSCKQLLDWNMLPASPPAGKTFVERTVTLYPDVQNKPTKSIKATCHIVRACSPL